MLNPYTGKTIFVQIASYRDSQLLPTLRDLFDKADEPDNLKVCICWQHSEEDTWDVLAEFENDERVIVIDVPSEESKGVCWARNLIQQKYNGEDFTIQLDSHHRFIKGWDTELKNEFLTLQLQGIKKPLLTGYISAFHPNDTEDKWYQEPWQMIFDRFTPDGVIFFKPANIPNWEELKAPVPGRFYSAHFTFTLGKFCEEVPHDPRYYFHGEEISIALRAYTHGYDIFHPHKVIAWHEYTRDYRPDKHWDNYGNWNNHCTQTYALMRGLLGIDGEESEDRFGEYGLGTERTVAEWEEYAGIRFRDRSVKQDTVDGELPPSDSTKEFTRQFKHCVDLHVREVPLDLKFLTIALHDKDNETLYRRDYTAKELLQCVNGEWLNIWIDTTIASKPSYIIIWPCTEEGWGERKTINW